MSENSWDAWSRYNKLGISKKIIELIHRLAKVNLVDLSKGSYSGPYGRGNRITRIRAAGALQEMFLGLTSSRDDVHQADGQECIILKDGEGEEARLLEYVDTDETTRMRSDLEAYNALIAETCIDVPTLEGPWVIRKDRFGKEVKVPVGHHHKFSRRIFSRGRWDLNGRFYGPWWQQISKEMRSRIFINDRPTVEIDFKGLHLAIIAAQQGLEIEGDPYELPAGTVPGNAEELQRDLVKQLVLTCLNAGSEKAAFKSFRDGWPAGHQAKKLSDEQLVKVLGRFIEKHPWSKASLGTDVGITLMNIDAKIAEHVLRHFTALGIPVLCIHDSFIIDYRFAGQLRAAMTAASREVVGIPLTVSGAAGLDDFFRNHHCGVVRDFITRHRRGITEAYRERLRAWETLKGRSARSKGRREPVAL